MKGLALETVVKWIILLVVAGVVINLVLFFSDRIVIFIRGFMEPDKTPKTDIIESDQFSTAQVKTYMRACWDKTGERFDMDVICFVLKGDMSGVDKDSLANAADPPASVDVAKFDKSKNMAVVRFEDIGNRIILES